MRARFDRSALLIVLASLPLRAWLATATQLSPDEAYYLCAARFDASIPDHPPLIVRLLAWSDPFVRVPLELRVRLWPLILSTLVSVALLDALRQRSRDPRAQRWLAVLASWTILPLTGGFVATPDFLLALAVACVIALEARSTQGVVHSVAGFLVALLGTLSKVAIAPVVIVAAWTSRHSPRYRLCLLAGMTCALAPALPSFAFQLHHAYVPSQWSVGSAVLALLAATSAQFLLWTPTAFVLGWNRLLASPGLERALAIAYSALVIVSALVRGQAPEPNWYVPAALVIALAASDVLPSSRRIYRVCTLVLGPGAALVASTHAIHPWLPLPTASDPTARLHGWTDDGPTRTMPGLGPYAAAAEQCVYRRSCDNIINIFKDLRSTPKAMDARHFWEVSH